MINLCYDRGLTIEKREKLTVKGRSADITVGTVVLATSLVEIMFYVDKNSMLNLILEVLSVY